MKNAATQVTMKESINQAETQGQTGASGLTKRAVDSVLVGQLNASSSQSQKPEQ